MNVTYAEYNTYHNSIDIATDTNSNYTVIVFNVKTVYNNHISIYERSNLV